ncbi:DUF1559 domain-containing protein [Paludisphaera sp.]|uniref:DUF1559 family PulG-like putative transporter n=1 Tax=Paludisphaera sp. TaxID=2017432 RepID=UPI00301C0049
MDRRAGLTLTDTLVILAIVAVGLGFVLPMLQSPRMIVCRVYCDNNLKNIALGVNQYCLREGSFPVNTTATPTSGLAHSWMALVMADVDEAGIYNNYNFAVPHDFDAAASGATPNSDLASTGIRIFRCPENRLGSRIDRAFAPSDYGANWGGGRLPSLGDDFARTRGNNRGVMIPVGFPCPRGLTAAVRPRDVTDGLATTVLLAEKRDGRGWAVPGLGGGDFDVATSPAPPDRPEGRAVVSGSFHGSDGEFINAAFADGSVRPLRRSTARAVWYALVTRDGGEPVGSDAY